jgi:hypothetical protein
VARAPGICCWIPLPYGAFRDFLRDSLEFQLRARERFGDVFRFRIGRLWSTSSIIRTTFGAFSTTNRGTICAAGNFGSCTVCSGTVWWFRKETAGFGSVRVPFSCFWRTICAILLVCHGGIGTSCRLTGGRLFLVASSAKAPVPKWAAQQPILSTNR